MLHTDYSDDDADADSDSIQARDNKAHNDSTAKSLHPRKMMFLLSEKGRYNPLCLHLLVN